ncbi:HIT family protein [Macrococcus hajekii]|uniref:HIT family protein n=1 Tax=Macrococcus hajekii TaxID=198482 RepID=A0A4R6BLT2_9STAP|nr:HIT family protein [Macrococcus hajekii]TDM02582.1 HIT family protein [Macrococcus hajekii]GGB02141.1 cell-cycle regulation protein HIT [Macrococcus hajekii]
MTDCIFCKIINGDIPAYKVYEDDYTLAFLDISQVAKGHTLVIPKTHSQDLLETDSEVLAHVIKSVQKVAQMIDKSLNPDGINIIQNNRAFADQSVFHLHFHIMPRYKDDIDGFGYKWQTHPDTFSQQEMTALTEQIKGA